MNCTNCFGTGVLSQGYHCEPCKDCGGYGVIHCCEGDKAADWGPADKFSADGEAPNCIWSASGTVIEFQDIKGNPSSAWDAAYAVILPDIKIKETGIG